MVFCWEADLQGRQGRRASRAKPGRGAGRAAVVEPWRAGKGRRDNNNNNKNNNNFYWTLSERALLTAGELPLP